MAKERELISQLQVTHFPSGESMDSRKLEEYKLAYEQNQSKKTVSTAIVIAGLVVAVIILSLLPGTVGYILAAVAFVVAAIVAVIQQRETAAEAAAAFKETGISRKDLKIAIKNVDKGAYAYVAKKPTKL